MEVVADQDADGAGSAVGGVDRRFAMMNTAFEYGLIAIPEAALAEFDLPDADDRHVAAGTKACEASVAITHNTKDFPAAALNEHGITALTPDDLMLGLLRDDRPSVLAVIDAIVVSTRSPRLSTLAVLNSIEEAGAPAFAKAVREALGGSVPR